MYIIWAKEYILKATICIKGDGMKGKILSTKIALIIILGMLFSDLVSAKTISNTLRVDCTVNLSSAIAKLVNSFNKEDINELKIVVDSFNLDIADLTPKELENRQSPIDEYFGAANTINLSKLRSDYNTLSQIEKLAVAKKIKDNRYELSGKEFLDYYKGQYAFLPAYAQALSTIKVLNGKLINIVWNDTGDMSKTYTVSANQTIQGIIKAKVEVKDFSISNVKYIVTCINDLTSEPVGKDVADGVNLKGEKIVIGSHNVTNEEIRQINLTFRQAGTYRIIIRAEY